MAHRPTAAGAWCSASRDFQRNYLPVNKYYFASGQNTAGRGPGLHPAAAWIPVTRMDPVTQTVQALLDGPGTLADAGGGLAASRPVRR